MTTSGILSKTKKTLLSLASVAFWILLWQLVAQGVNKKLILKIPYPLDTVRAFFENCTDFSFWKIVFVSLLHILSGFLVAVVTGICMGMLSGRCEAFRLFASPALHLVRTVPVAAVIIVAWLWIPSYALPSFIAFLMVLPIIWSHAEAALKSVDPKLIEMAKVGGMSNTNIALKIKFPLIAVHIRTGCITGVGIAWKAGVAAQIIASPVGTLGSSLAAAKTTINYTQVFAITLAIILLSIFVENIIKVLWKEQKYD